MRKFLFLLILIVAGLIAAPFFIPVDAYKPRLEEAASAALGRDVKMAGDVQLAFLPRFEAVVQDVSIGNADWAKAESFASMKEMAIGFDLMPLLSGELALDRFRLVEPVINLEQDKQGRSNWAFLSQGRLRQPARAATSRSLSLGTLRWKMAGWSLSPRKAPKPMTRSMWMWLCPVSLNP